MRNLKFGALIVGVLMMLFMAGQASASGIDFKAGYVNSRALLAVHPIYDQLVAVEEQMEADALVLDGQIQELLLLQRERQLSEEEQELLNVSIMTINSLSATYDEEVDGLLQQVLPDVNHAIAKAAELGGFLMVFDFYGAYEAGIIAYADPSLDLTEAAKAILNSMLNPN